MNHDAFGGRITLRRFATRCAQLQHAAPSTDAVRALVVPVARRITFTVRVSPFTASPAASRNGTRSPHAAFVAPLES